MEGAPLTAPTDRRIARANAAAGRQAWPEAIAAVREILAGSASLACSPFLPLLTSLYVHGRIAEGNEILRAFAGRIPDPHEAALLSDVWSVFLHESGDPVSAADRCRIVLEGAPRDPRLWTNLAACLAAAGHAGAAVDAADAALERDPNHLRADYLKCRAAPHETFDLHGQDPYATRYARLFLEMVPPFAGLSEVLDVSLHEMPGDLWICVSVREESSAPFPARPGLPVIAATWNEQGFFLRSGVVNAVSPEEQRIEVRGTGPEGLWIQRRSHIRISADDFAAGEFRASSDAFGDVAVQDISGGGISFLSREGIAPGTAMAITLVFYGETLATSAVVRRCVPKGDRFLVGAEFLPDEDLAGKLLEKLQPGGPGGR